MSNFETCGEAWKYCEKYGLNKINPSDAFKIAEALLNAYNDGMAQSNAKTGAEGVCQCDSPLFYSALDTKCLRCDLDLRG